MIEPLSQTHVPQMVQNLALPKPLEKNSSSLKEQLEKDTYHNHPYNHHTIVKRSILGVNIPSKTDNGRMESKLINNAPKHVTPDPLLVELFASTNTDIQM